MKRTLAALTAGLALGVGLNSGLAGARSSSLAHCRAAIATARVGLKAGNAMLVPFANLYHLTKLPRTAANRQRVELWNTRGVGDWSRMSRQQISLELDAAQC